MRKIYAEEDHGMTRVAILEDGELVEYYIEREGNGRLTGSVFLGRVQNVLPGMQAAFIDIGFGKNAFLFLGDTKGEYGQDLPPIRLKIGQPILVQVAKEPEGNKGPRVTTHVTLPGKIGVLITDMDYIGVSRRIEDERERDRLRGEVASFKPDGKGMILRTAAVGLTAAELKPEMDGLLEQWSAIQRRANSASPPACLHREDSLLHCSIRDLFNCSTEQFIVSDESLLQKAIEEVKAFSPQFLSRLVCHQGEEPLFDVTGINPKAEKALSHKVWLKNGGYLIIDHTEALTVIDVNTGKFVGNKNLQDTVYRMNIEAAAEIARQLRLRDIGGIIIIDFIDMEEAEMRERLVETLRCALKNDRNRTNLVGLTGLGLVEMTRKKTRASLPCVAQSPCPDCEGSGKVLKADLVARRAMRDIRRRRASGMDARIRMTARPEVIDAFRHLGCAPDVETVISSRFRPEEVEIQIVIADIPQD